jgi:hypothetical protein
VSLTEPIVRLHGRADPREEGRLQVIENEVGVDKDRNAEVKQKASANRETHNKRHIHTFFHGLYPDGQQ